MKTGFLINPIAGMGGRVGLKGTDGVLAEAVAGTYHHYVPPMVTDVLHRPSLYSAYTPYQPELSQGTLQAMFEYQSLIAALMGLPVSNASHYDGATALAEAIMLALSAAKNKVTNVVLSGNLNPQYQQVAKTYLGGLEVELINDGMVAASKAQMLSHITDDTAALVVQTPGFLGELVDLSTLADAIHTVGGLLIVVGDPIAMGLFEPPGSFGADIVVAEGQSLGLPPTYGGPRLGIFAVRQQYVRQLAGRLVGETKDKQGRRGYVLTLATREQHIRRARATSNICTNSALAALAAAVYLATVGKSGLRETAQLCFHNSHYLADQLRDKLKLSINPQLNGKSENLPWFREFVVELPCSANRLNQNLTTEKSMVGGLDLACVYAESPDWDKRMLVAVTEVHSKADLDAFVSAMGTQIKKLRNGGNND